MECNALLVPAWAIELCCRHSHALHFGLVTFTHRSSCEGISSYCRHPSRWKQQLSSSSLFDSSLLHLWNIECAEWMNGEWEEGLSLWRTPGSLLELIFSLNWAGAVAWWSCSSPFLLPTVLSGCTQRLFQGSENKLVQGCQPWVTSTRISFNPSQGPGPSGYFPLSSARKQTWKG